MPNTEGEIGPPPKRLTEEAAAVWQEVAQSIPEGIAGRSDRLVVEIAVRLLCESRSSYEAMPTSRISLLAELLSRLGMDPQGRTRINKANPQEPPKGDDEYAFLN